jgi:hypothetical protein
MPTEREPGTPPQPLDPMEQFQLADAGFQSQAHAQRLAAEADYGKDQVEEAGLQEIENEGLLPKYNMLAKKIDDLVDFILEEDV